MKRVLATLAHPGHAGMLRALAVLEGAASRYGWELHYVVAGDHPLVRTMLPRERTHVLRGLGGWRRWYTRVTGPLIIRQLSRLAADADLLYSVTLSTFPFCSLAGRATGRPQVVHVYSSYGAPAPYRKHLLGRARHVIAPSADSLRLAADAVGGFGADTRARVVYNGMDIARIADEAAAASSLHFDDRPLIGMVGNLDWRKNPLLLVEAAALVRKVVPRLRVLLIGEFADRAYAARVRERIVDLDLEHTVEITGFLPNPFPAVQRLDVLVHPALRDPFPLALLEGMALARPIVASAVGGIPEMLVDGESGCLVPPNDATALADAVALLLRDPRRRERIGAAAYMRLTTQFSLDGFAAAMFGAFDAALGRAEG